MIDTILYIMIFLCRGYGETSIPSLNYEDYSTDLLAQDVKEVVRVTINIYLT